MSDRVSMDYRNGTARVEIELVLASGYRLRAWSGPQGTQLILACGDQELATPLSEVEAELLALAVQPRLR